MGARAGYPEQTICNVAQEISAGMVCYLNLDTLETESVMGESYNVYWDDDFSEYYQKTEKILEGWKRYIRFTPPEPWESFKIMEDFVGICVPDSDKLKERLWNALSGKKPFRNFKYLIEGSGYRQIWFEYRQSRLEEMVRSNLEISSGAGI